MGRTGAAGCISGGGQVIAQVDATRVRIATGAAALATALALAIYPVLAAPATLRGLLTLLAVLAVVAVGLALVRYVWAAGSALLLLAGICILLQLTRGWDVAMLMLYPAGLVVLAELLFFAREIAGARSVEKGVLAGMAMTWAFAAAGAMLLGALIAGVTALEALPAALGALLSVTAQVLILGLALAMLWRCARSR